MASFEETVQKLVTLARSDDVPMGSAPVDNLVDAYLSGFAGNRALERDRLANAFEQMVSRRAERSDFVYMRVKRLA